MSNIATGAFEVGIDLGKKEAFVKVLKRFTPIKEEYNQFFSDGYEISEELNNFEEWLKEQIDAI